jgi:hypothetical protein
MPDAANNVSRRLHSSSTLLSKGQGQLCLPCRSPKRGGKRTGKKAFVPTVRASLSASGRNKSSPLSSLLADYKEAEAKWNHEKVGKRARDLQMAKQTHSSGKLRPKHRTPEKVSIIERCSVV